MAAYYMTSTLIVAILYIMNSNTCALLKASLISTSLVLRPTHRYTWSPLSKIMTSSSARSSWGEWAFLIYDSKLPLQMYAQLFRKLWWQTRLCRNWVNVIHIPLLLTSDLMLEHLGLYQTLNFTFLIKVCSMNQNNFIPWKLIVYQLWCSARLSNNFSLMHSCG